MTICSVVSTLRRVKTHDYYVRHEPGSDRVPREAALNTPRLPIWGILDRIRSAHNVGSMFRTSDGAHIGGLFLCEYTPAPPHRHLSKTALGAVDVVPFQQFENVNLAIQAARENGAQILALEKCEDSVDLWDFDLQFPIALVVGNEKDGVDEETRALCDATVHLPMRGHKNSLNVSVAFGIALYEILRRYEKTK